MTHHDDTGVVGTLLAQLAESELLPPPPSYTALISGGRRRLVRRRAALAGAAALAVTAVGTAVALPGTAAHQASAPAASTAGPAPAKPTTPAADPMTPSPSVVIGQGKDNQGHTWRVSARLWPAPRTQDEALAQLRAIAADEKFPPGWGPVDDSWVPPQFKQNHIQLSGSLDGKRYPNPSYDDAGLPGMPGTTTNPYDVETGTSGVFIGPESRIEETRTMVGTVADDVQRVSVLWSDGTSYDLPLVRVSGSAQRWFAVRAQHGLTGVLTEYGAGGKVIMRDTKSFRKDAHF